MVKMFGIIYGIEDIFNLICEEDEVVFAEIIKSNNVYAVMPNTPFQFFLAKEKSEVDSFVEQVEKTFGIKPLAVRDDALVEEKYIRKGYRS